MRSFVSSIRSAHTDSRVRKHVRDASVVRLTQHSLQTLSNRSVSWENAAIRKQCAIFEAEDEADVVTECPTETAPFGCAGRKREIEGHNTSFKDHQEVWWPG